MILGGGLLFLLSPRLAPHAEKLEIRIGRKFGWIEPEKPKVPALPPLPERFDFSDRVETTSIFNGMTLRADIKTTEGQPASIERTLPDSYLLDVSLKIQAPAPWQTADAFRAAVPEIDQAFPGLAGLIASSKVSPFYYSLYQRKIDFTRNQIGQFQMLLSRHNFFDCDTILELTNPTTSQKALLIQSEMDVVTDGTDPDRTLTYEASSNSFQPFTSYSWAKKSKAVNPAIAPRDQEVTDLTARLRQPGITGAEASRARERITVLKTEIAALKYRSSLVAALDPFVVVPMFMVKHGDNVFAPRIGDYAVVLYKGIAYPAIVGDTGPDLKTGEASIRIARTINSDATGMSRSVSDLNVTYLVFPGSVSEPFGPPDLAKWREKCAGLLEKLGVQATLFDWNTQPSIVPPTPPETLRGEDIPVAAPVPPSETHVIVWGESLWTIAKKYGITIDQIKAWNNLPNDKIKPGQILKVKAPAETPATNPPVASPVVPSP
jgi:hypothetical protein